LAAAQTPASKRRAEAAAPETERRAPSRPNTAATAPGRARPAAEPRIFVPPRAPDDPGTGAAAEEDVLVGDLRSSAAKA
jgi:hypothetical protein